MRKLALVLFALAACSRPEPEPNPIKPPEAAAAPASSASAPAAAGQTEKEKARTNPYPNDLGPERLPESALATYDPQRRKGYDLMLVRCAQCHAASRPLNSRFDDSDTWNRYVKRMMNKPGCAITKAEGKAIWQFLSYDSEKRKKGANLAAWKELRAKLVAEFKEKYPKRYEELKAANDL